MITTYDMFVIKATGLLVFRPASAAGRVSIELWPVSGNLGDVYHSMGIQVNHFYIRNEFTYFHVVRLVGLSGDAIDQYRGQIFPRSTCLTYLTFFTGTIQLRNFFVICNSLVIGESAMYKYASVCVFARTYARLLIIFAYLVCCCICSFIYWSVLEHREL